MKKKSLIVFLLFVFSNISYSQTFENFFQPRKINPLISSPAPDIWEFKPIVQVPALKVTESNRENATLDATMLVSAGGGITLQHTVQKDGKNYAEYGFSFVVLLSGDTKKEGSVLDLSLAFTGGAFNNLLQLGAGLDLGEVEVDQPRWFLVGSFGINLTNN